VRFLLRSLLTLRFINARLFLDPIRECYEAFVIYNFYMFLIAYLEVRLFANTAFASGHRRSRLTVCGLPQVCSPSLSTTCLYSSPPT